MTYCLRPNTLLAFFKNRIISRFKMRVSFSILFVLVDSLRLLHKTYNFINILDRKVARKGNMFLNFHLILSWYPKKKIFFMLTYSLEFGEASLNSSCLKFCSLKKNQQLNILYARFQGIYHSFCQTFVGRFCCSCLIDKNSILSKQVIVLFSLKGVQSPFRF